MEIMKKFMKMCFVLALVLIIVGSVLYMLGRGRNGREIMDEMLWDAGDWVDLGNLFEGGGSAGEFAGYELDEISMFDSDHTTWKGNLEKQLIGQGGVEQLVLDIGGSMVEIKDSDDENIYIEGKSIGKMQAYVEGNVLYVRSVRPANLAEEIKNSKIILYLPEDCSMNMISVSLGAGQLQLGDMKVDNMQASIGAGQLLMEDMDIGWLEVSLGAGELRADDVTVQTLSASIGAGNMEFSGAINESADISCSMGNVSMELEGEKQDFNYQLSCVAGNMNIDGDSFAGAAMDRTINNGADKYMDIDCSMGNVEVDF